MTPRSQEWTARKRESWAERRRGELIRERESRRLLPAVAAKRDLDARRAHDSRTKSHPVRLRDGRFAYLTQSHD
jgi:hypothetical protein